MVVLRTPGLKTVSTTHLVVGVAVFTLDRESSQVHTTSLDTSNMSSSVSLSPETGQTAARVSQRHLVNNDRTTSTAGSQGDPEIGDTLLSSGNPFSRWISSVLSRSFLNEMICYCCHRVCVSVCPNRELWPDRSTDGHPVWSKKMLHSSGHQAQKTTFEN
jgi:hypothetical protein